MEQSRAVLGHGKRVMKAIENAVATLQDHEVLESYFTELGERHVNRKLKAHHLKVSIYLLDIIVRMVRTAVMLSC